ncbi:MAG: DUF4037 domain-containing protein [Candidatus Eisenbacteria bacterium]|uniref:DUF4037 domain-containing protein n=1 Tax=Eiseniibacteriota bacterium TaxID=2212470 RepID=A0A948RWQ1_UNCEI|nr:DUF4037 domain-containing protein [Candidatus Eisenbacteria bacterium]MBU2692435.1 DUF4037 domain-containing protein [Candidatus Eisenbacteria bacterium]
MKTKPLNSPFIPGLRLAESFYNEFVGPIISSQCPNLKYTAALVGSGSEVLEFDTEMSMDHHWGPRVMLFLSPKDYKKHKFECHEVLAEKLPAVFRGIATNFTEPDPNDGTQHLLPVDSGPINHRVEFFTFKGYFKNYFNIDIDKELQPADWLTLPHQKLRSIVAGAVFHDELGWGSIRKRFTWYPHDIWLYLLASGWSRIGEEEHLMGRAGHAGDNLGSSLIAARLVRDIMRLAFLMERVYPPYAKWFGSAFGRLECASKLEPLLIAAVEAANWQERELGLCAAYSVVAEMHNSLGLTKPLPVIPSVFWCRPFKVIHGETFAKELKACIKDPVVKDIASKRLIGNIDLFSDNVDLLEDSSRRLSLLELY